MNRVVHLAMAGDVCHNLQGGDGGLEFVC